MKLVHCLSLACLLSACTSHAWRRELVDGGPERDAGAFLSMHYHRDGQNKKLAIVYEDGTAGRIRVATREGVGHTWGAFETQDISHRSAQKPASTMGPDGTVYVAFAYPSRLTQQNTYRIYVTEPSGPAGEWEAEYVTVSPLSLRNTDQPPTIAYLRQSDGPGSLHVAWSVLGSRAIMHARQDVGDVDWTADRLGGPESELEGIRPALLATDDFTNLQLFYGHHGDQGGFSGLAGAYRTQLGWQGPNPVGAGLSEPHGRFQAKTIVSANAEGFDDVGVVYADCDGKPAYRAALNSGSTNWADPIVPGIPTDPERDFCEASFAHDHQGRVHIAAYDYDVGAVVVFFFDPGPQKWAVEFVENGPGEMGRYPSIVYDPLADEFIVAYYDRAKGQLKIATRDADSQ
jgi:hypothetical protein